MTTTQTPVDALMELVVAYAQQYHNHRTMPRSTTSPAFDAARAAVEASARALAAVPAAEVQESVRWKQLVHMVERGVAPEILVDWINHPNRLDYAAKLRAEHG